MLELEARLDAVAAGNLGDSRVRAVGVVGEWESRLTGTGEASNTPLREKRHRFALQDRYALDAVAGDEGLDGLLASWSAVCDLEIVPVIRDLHVQDRGGIQRVGIADHDVGEGVYQQVVHREVGSRSRTHRIAEVETPRHDVAVTEPVIDPAHPLVVVDPRSIGVDQVQCLPLQIRRGPQDFLKLLGRSVDHAGRDPVVRHRAARQCAVRILHGGERIEEWIRRSSLRVHGKVAAEHLRRRYDVQQSGLPAPALAFVHEEKEGSVLGNGAADCRAELILAKLGLRRAGTVREELRSVQVVVANEFEYRAVDLVSAGLGDDVDIRSGGRSELSRSDVRLDLEFLNGIDRGLQPVGLEEALVVVHAVQRVVVGLAAQPADRHGGAGCLECRQRSGAGHGARRQDRELREAAAVQGQLYHLFVVDRRRDCRAVGLQLHRRSTDFDDLGNFADRQGEIHAQGLVHCELNAGLLGLVEAGHFGCNRIHSWRERRNGEATCFTGRNDTGVASALVRNSYGDAGHDGPALIRDITENRPE